MYIKRHLRIKVHGIYNYKQNSILTFDTQVQIVSKWVLFLKNRINIGQLEKVQLLYQTIYYQNQMRYTGGDGKLYWRQTNSLRTYTTYWRSGISQTTLTLFTPPIMDITLVGDLTACSILNGNIKHQAEIRKRIEYQGTKKRWIRWNFNFNNRSDIEGRFRKLE